MPLSFQVGILFPLQASESVAAAAAATRPTEMSKFMHCAGFGKRNLLCLSSKLWDRRKRRQLKVVAAQCWSQRGRNRFEINLLRRMKSAETGRFIICVRAMACFKKIGFTTTVLNDTNFRSIRWYLERIYFLLQWAFKDQNGFAIDPVLEDLEFDSRRK